MATYASLGVGFVGERGRRALSNDRRPRLHPVLALCGLATAKRSPTSEGTLAGLGVVELLDSRYRECRSHAVIVFAIREFESSRPSHAFCESGDVAVCGKLPVFPGGCVPKSGPQIGDRRKGAFSALILPAVSNAVF